MVGVSNASASVRSMAHSEATEPLREKWRLWQCGGLYRVTVPKVDVILSVRERPVGKPKWLPAENVAIQRLSDVQVS